MAEEKDIDVEQVIAIENNGDSEPMRTAEEGSEENVALPLVQKDITEILGQESAPEVVNARRHSTGVIDMRPGKLKIQSRYLRDPLPSTHDLCKRGKRREDDGVKPWKLVKKKTIDGEDAGKAESFSTRRMSLGGAMPKKTENFVSVKKKNVDGEDAAKAETLSMRRRSLGGVMPKKTENFVSVKKKNVDGEDAAKAETLSMRRRSLGGAMPKKAENFMSVKKNMVVSDKPDSIEISGKEDSEVVRSGNDDSNVKKGKMKKTENTLKESAVSRMATSLRNKKWDKVGKSSGSKGSKEGKEVSSSLKNAKEVQKTKAEIVGSDEAVKEKTVYVVESSVKKKFARIIQKSLKVNQDASSAPKDKASRATKPLSKSESKRAGIKLMPFQKQVSVKRGNSGKGLEPKPEGSTPSRFSFRRRVEKGKGRRESEGSKSKNNEGKPERVVLRHRNVEANKKLQTLFNNMIEETASKLAKARKGKVKALVGAFETVISLQDNKKSPQRFVQRQKASSSASI